MSSVIVTGAGMNGLVLALLLAADGHEVTVLERDGAEPPSPGEAWDAWERRGVNQFRLLHYLQPGWREIVEREVPAVADALDAAGALRFNPLALIPEQLTGGFRDGDEAFTALTARRPVAEAAVASVVAGTPGITVRRGVPVAALRTGPSAIAGVPHVTGVVTEAGEELGADLVVDTMGRRSPLPGWLAAAGARPPRDEEEDVGFVYYGRHFRSADGSVPPMIAPLLQPYDSLSVLTLPADNGTWGVGLVASGGDAELRVLRDDDTWMRAMRALPLFAHWVDGEPLDSVTVMAGIPDRRRWFVVDGAPVATGVAAVGDSWACTNPSLGRGITIGLRHAVALRDLLRAGGLDDPAAFPTAWDEATESSVGGWVDATLAFDRHRLAEMSAQIDGRAYDPGDPTWEVAQAMRVGTGADPEVLRGYLHLGGLLGEPTVPPELAERALAAGGHWRDAPSTGPSRPELLAVLAS
jgi:2-polyprenyl-6-methoxyphenol hydroxylase-like FAD-dependent oxidoreductase